MKLTKAQIDHFTARLNVARCAYIAALMAPLGEEPEEVDYSGDEKTRMINSGIATPKQNAGDMYGYGRDMFNYPRHPESPPASAIEAYENAKREAEAKAQQKYDAAMDKLMFMGTGEDIVQLLATAFA